LLTTEDLDPHASADDAARHIDYVDGDARH
jgi:hypothetical protein